MPDLAPKDPAADKAKPPSRTAAVPSKAAMRRAEARRIAVAELAAVRIEVADIAGRHIAAAGTGAERIAIGRSRVAARAAPDIGRRSRTQTMHTAVARRRALQRPRWRAVRIPQPRNTRHMKLEICRMTKRVGNSAAAGKKAQRNGYK